MTKFFTEPAGYNWMASKPSLDTWMTFDLPKTPEWPLFLTRHLNDLCLPKTAEWNLNFLGHMKIPDLSQTLEWPLNFLRHMKDVLSKTLE